MLSFLRGDRGDKRGDLPPRGDTSLVDGLRVDNSLVEGDKVLDLDDGEIALGRGEGDVVRDRGKLAPFEDAVTALDGDNVCGEIARGDLRDTTTFFLDNFLFLANEFSISSSVCSFTEATV